MIRCLMAAGLAMLGACASPPPENPAVAAAEANRICKRITPTGSNMPQRVCQTPEEWAAVERAGREGVEEMKRQTDALGTGGQIQ